MMFLMKVSSDSMYCDKEKCYFQVKENRSSTFSDIYSFCLHFLYRVHHSFTTDLYFYVLNF